MTYLFEGSIYHRDSLGTQLPIVPGDVNLDDRRGEGSRTRSGRIRRCGAGEPVVRDPVLGGLAKDDGGDGAGICPS